MDKKTERVELIMRRILLIGLIVITAATARAQFWTKLNGPYGGDIHDLPAPAVDVAMPERHQDADDAVQRRERFPIAVEEVARADRGQGLGQLAPRRAPPARVAEWQTRPV